MAITAKIGCQGTEAQITNQSQLPRLARNDFFAADRDRAPQCAKKHGASSEGGKQRSRCNAVRHGLTAETVIGALENAEDYKVFEAAITADYDAQSTVERQLVRRLASLLWRLHRATTIDTGLFEIQADHLKEARRDSELKLARREVLYALFQRADAVDPAAAGIIDTSEN